MANYNGVRPPRTRPAGAGRVADAASPAPLLLALFAALAAAFLVSQLASSTGSAEPSRVPAFLADALGAPQTGAPLTREPVRDVSVAIRDSSYGVTAKQGSVSLASAEAGTGEWRRFVNGASRPTAFGFETIVVEPKKTEQYLTVTRRQGATTWTWELATTLEPLLAKDGGVDFVVSRQWHAAHHHFHGPQLAQYRIAPVAIADVDGKDVTPAGLRWSLAHRGESWWLELRLDDSSLPVPYVIDPAITFRGAAGSSNGGEATLILTMPTGVVANDFLIAQVSVRGGTGTTITPPGGWTPLRRDDNGTALGQALYYRVATSSEPLSYTWTQSPAVRASGGIIAYTGVDNSDPIDVVGSAGGNSSLVTAPSITTSAANEMVVGFFGMPNCNNGGDYWTPPLGMNERYDINSTGAFTSRTNSEGADVLQAIAGPTGPKTATASSSGQWIGQLVALRLDTTLPTAPVQTITESAADSHASGSTFYYRPAGAGSTFTVTAATSDGQSGLNKVNLPGLAGGFSPTTGLDDTASPYQQTYTWTTGSTESGAKTVTATDNAGNTNTGTFTVTPDSTAPTTTDNTAAIGSSWKNTNQTVTLTPSDGSGSGVATTYYTTDGTTPTTASPQGTSVSLTSNGSYTIKYFSVDNVGNSESVKTAGTVINIDKTNPTSSTLDPLPATIRNGQVLTGSATDGGPSGIASLSYYYCAGPPCTPSTLIGSSSSGPSYSVTWSSQPADGDYQVLARATDNAGNTLDSSKRTVTIDNTPPNTTITASPANPSNNADPSFSFTSSEGGSTFECKLDAGAFAACTSPKSYTGLSAGSHTFEVKATDAVGNVDATPASYTWTIDLTPPNTTIDSSPANPSNNANPSFSFSSSEGGSTFECKLDAGAFAACTSPKSYTSLSGGSHTFEVKATDAAGNVDATPASYTWTIDLTEPVTSIDSSPANPSNNANPSFSFSSNEAGSTFECKLDAGAFAACTSPKSYTSLSAGSHTFEVRATDTAGNVDSTPASYTWTIDLTEPITSIDSNPSDPSNNANPSFTFSSNEAGSSFACEFDSGGFSPCTSPKSYSSLSNASHTFRVRATDGAGNTDSTPASFTWLVDTANPTSSFSFPASGGSYTTAAWNAGCATAGFCGTYSDASGSGVQKVEISIRQGAGNYWDGTGFTSASEVWSLASLSGGNWSYAFAAADFPANGNFTVRLRATDNATNAEAPSSRTFAYDTAAPSSAMTFPASGGSYTTAEWNAGCATIGFCGTHSDATSGVQKVEISIRRGAGNYWDGTSFASASEVWNMTALSGSDWEYSFGASSFPADGSYTIRVKATDNAGNAEAPSSRTFTYDSANPSSTTSFPASGGAYRTSTWDAGCATAGFCGTHSDATSGVQKVEISIRRGAGNYWDGSSFGSASEVWNASTLSGNDWSYAFAATSFPADGSYTIRVRATDNAGNVEAPSSRSFTFDSANPSALFTFPDAGANYTAAEWDAGCATSGFCGTHSDGTSGVQQVDLSVRQVSTNLYWNGVSFSNLGETYFAATLSGSNWSYAFASANFPAGGDYVAHVRATDNAGNIEAGPSRTFSYDTIPPDTTIDSAPATPTTSTSASFSFSSSEPGSTFECELDGAGFSACTSPKSYSSLADGSHTFGVRARDGAGNADPTPASHTWVVDTTAPTSSTTFPAGGAGYNAASWNGGCAAAGFCGTYADGSGSGVQEVEISIRRGAGNYWEGTSFASASEVWNVATLAGGNWSYAFAAASFPADGSYTIRVKATDNVSLAETPAARTFTYDTADPSALFSFPASGGDYRNSTWNSGCATVGFCGTHSDATSGVQAVEVSIQRLSDSKYWDGSGFTGASETFFSAALSGSSWSYAFAAGNFPADGQYAVHVRARDNAANTETGPSRAFRIDNTDPSALYIFPAAGGAYNASGWNAGCASSGFCGTHADAGSGVQQVEISIKRVSTDLYWGGAGFASGTETFFSASLSGSNWSYAFPAASFPTDGSYTVHVRARDNAGNTEPGPNRTFTIDSAAPNTVIDSAPANPTSSASASFSFSASEPGSSFECELDGAGFSACTTPANYVGLGDGSHTFKVRAVDPALNTDPSPASFTWLIDTAAPSSTIGFPDAGGFYKAVTWNAGCATSGYCGTHSDPSGSGVQKVEVSLKRLSTNLYWNGASFANGAETFFTASLSGSNWSYAFAAANFPADGDYQIRVKATDNATNPEAAASRTFTYDATLPSGSLTAPSTGAAVRGASVTVSSDSSDATSGVASVTFERRPSGGGSWSAIGSDASNPYSLSWDTTPLTDGDYELRVVTTDQAGNSFSSPTVTVTIDNANPSSATLDALPSAIRNGFVLTGSGADATSGVASLAYYYCAGPPCAPATLIGSSSTGPSYSLTWNGQPADGDYQILARVTDRAGNSLDSAKQTVKIDNTDPSGSLTGPADDATVSGTVPVSSNSADNVGGSGVASATFQYRTSPAGAWTTIGSPDTAAPYSVDWSTGALTDGDYDLRVVTADVAGNQVTSAARTVHVDNHQPEVTITSPGASVNASAPDPFTVTATSPDNDIEDVAFFRCDNASVSCSTGSWVSLGAPDPSEPYEAPWPVDPDGNRALRAVATDHAGNTGVDVVNTTIDRVLPNTTITASPADPSNDAGPSFSFTSSEAGSTFQCKLDGGAFTACTSPKSYTGLAAGSHTFEVRATDAAGNTDSTPASYTWTIDLTDPQTTITASPADPSNDAGPSFSFTSSEAGSTFQCKLDGGAFAACMSPKSYSGLAAGSHTFEVKATDAAGNTDSTPASYTWTIDLTAPNTTITASPADPSNSADPSFSFTSSESGSTFECKLDGGAFAACTSPKSYTGLAAGSHTFEVKATDAAGNTDATPASYTWTIDLTDPQTTITASPPDPSNDPGPSFSFTSSESGSTFECKLDGGAFAACTSPKSNSGLAAGSHTFEVKATDAAGNTDATPASHTWTIDLTDPQTTLDAGPADPTGATGASFSFSSSEAGSTFQCRLDGAAFATCTSPKSYSGLAAGSHTFEVKATDAAGNTDPTPASQTWAIDLTAPETTIDSAPADPSNDTSPTFAFSANESGVTFQCELDGAGYGACASPLTYPGPVGDGPHTFKVKSTDAAGNADLTEATHTWTTDTAAPDTTIDIAPADPSNDATPTFEFSSSEAGATFQCKLDAGAFASCVSPATYGPLVDGPHSFQVKATDAAGNTDPTPASYAWLLNSGAPTISITAPSGFVNAGDADPFTVTATTPDGDLTSVDFFRCDNASVDCASGSWVLFGSDPSAPYSASWPVDADGNRALRAVATDVGTNTGDDVVNVTIDRTLPATTIDSGPADPSTSSSASFAFSASESGATFACRLDGGSFAACVSPKSYTGLADGAHVFEVRATDAAGNVEVTPPTYPWTIDTAAPQTTITVNPADPSSSASADFEFASSEAGSSFRCELDGAGFSACTGPKSYTGLGDGSHTFKVKAIDTAGNADATPATYTWLVDATGPDGGLADPGSPLRGAVTLSASPNDDGAGVKEVEFQYSPANDGSWIAIGVDDTDPYTASWNTTAIGDGLYDLRVMITDNALNSTTSAEVQDRLVDNTDPTAAMSDPGSPLRSTVTLASSTDDGPAGSGIATVVYQRSPAGANTWTAVPQNWDTTGAADGLYDLRVVATDNAGNSQASAPVTDRRVDNTKPGLSSSTPADGSTVDSATSLTVVGSESLAGVANATIDGAAAPPPVVSGTSVTYTLPFAIGPHTLAGELEDLAGNRTPIRVHFTVLSSAAAEGMIDLPYTEKNSYASAATSLAASDGLAEVTVPLAAWTGAAIGDWLVIRIDPRPMLTALASGFQADGDILDVTAYWALAGTEVHDFAKALDIRVNASTNALPSVLDGSAWRMLTPVAGTTLPSSSQDGFYRDGTNVHILTRHLSSFALLRDVQRPTKPKSFRGENSSGKLVLRWSASTDNSGLIGKYAVYANGKKIKTLAASARSVDLGAFRTTDSRKFQLRAYDLAGNASKLTYKLAIVPAVRNLTLTEATTRITGRAFKVGSISRAYSSAVTAGHVISSGRTGVARTGTAITLTVSLGSASRASTSSGTGTSSGSTGTSGTSGTSGSTGFAPQPPPAPSGSTGAAPPPPPPASDGSGSGSADAEGDIITTFESNSQSEGSGLRKALGLALLAAAFLVAAAALARSRRRRREEVASAAAVEPVLFWDTRLLQFATSAVRRITGRP